MAEPVTSVKRLLALQGTSEMVQGQLHPGRALSEPPVQAWP